MRPRGLMGMKIFRESRITEFLIHSLQKDENDELKLPEKGSVSEEEINAISKTTPSLILTSRVDVNESSSNRICRSIPAFTTHRLPASLSSDGRC
jgi:hypothetical protein